VNRKLAQYLAAPVLLNLGLFIHVLLFNLYLADLGYREDFMGRQAALLTLGTALGTIPGAILVRRWGLRLTGLLATAGVALTLLMRAQSMGVALSVASVALGLMHGVWLVTNTPAIASLSLGPLGFSLNIGFSIAVGTIGGFVGGRLPGWIGMILSDPMLSTSPADLKRIALMLAALPVAIAAAVIAQISFPAAPPKDHARIQASRIFLLRYLPVVALWYAFCAGFSPFFNAYLRNRLSAPLPVIGTVFALSHLPQAAAILLMPIVIARLGLVRSVVATQVLAALGVLAMWQARTIPQAAAVYMLYLSLQVMSEPGLQNLLMRGVPAAERPPAMAANLLLMFGINAAVGLGAGRLIVERGYSALFVVLSVTGLAAAALFAFLFQHVSERPFPADTALPASGVDTPPAPPLPSANEATDRSAPG
jgi:hypothetical protein